MNATTGHGRYHKDDAGHGDGPVTFSRVHRLLIATVLVGAIVIAGIGFAGSYAAVRELAIEKGFGNFSYVFPIGIDAGICVLLALDLLLTWIRIPFPLLRQTAWLLTMATIAFNGAAAWPDPLGVGMHAVIPILFVVSVEAARHAIGRIADITADKHMEGVRLTRWMLSPLPTFLLWRRMKLWELRSYEQVIKLEQERLVYQARMRSRYGRAWRRKAPVESLMPLRLAKYGIPLAQTAPAGLAAASIKPVLLPLAPAGTTPIETTPLSALKQSVATAADQFQPSTDAAPKDDNPWIAALTPHETLAHDGYGFPHASDQNPQEHDEQQTLPETQHAAVSRPETEDVHLSAVGAAGDFSSAGPASSSTREQEVEQPSIPAVEQFNLYPEISRPSVPVSDNEGAAGAASPPLPAHEKDEFASSIDPQKLREASSESNHPPPVTASPNSTRTERELLPHTTDPAGHGLSNTETAPGPRPETDQSAASGPSLSTVDQYFLAWRRLQQRYGREPNGSELSTSLAEQHTVDRDGHPIKQKTLTRYLLEFRIYTVWAELRATTPSPILDHVIKVLAERGVTAQYNRPIQTADLERRLAGFERRWHTLSHHCGAEHEPAIRPHQSASWSPSASSPQV